jgi:hypothetical protein
MNKRDDFLVRIFAHVIWIILATRQICCQMNFSKRRDYIFDKAIGSF